MNIQELTAALEYSREQLFQAELRFDQVTESDLIDAAICEMAAWDKRCNFYHRKLREVVAGGQALQRNGLVQFGGKR